MESKHQRSVVSSPSASGRVLAALAGVGALAGVAQAQLDLFLPVQAAQGEVYAFEYPGPIDQNHDARNTWDPFSIAVDADDNSTGASWRLSNAIGVTARSDEDGYGAFASIDSMFLPTQTIDIVLEWNFNADPEELFSKHVELLQVDSQTGDATVLLSRTSGAGSAGFTLETSDVFHYWIRGATAASGGSGEGFVWMTPVPAPGSAALLALGGLAAARRRS
jgi:hypothetical protein